jgi:maleylpyruvate isomerase
MRLHTYFRSSAAYRVRIALNLKGVAADQVSHDLRTGAHDAASYAALNPQRLVPALETQDGVLTQSLAICEYLDERFPDPPLLDGDFGRRARIRGFAQAIACDIHPVQNLRILSRLRVMGHDEEEARGWAANWVEEGLEACERLIAGGAGPFCFGPGPTLGDVFLVPQLTNARRFGVDVRWPHLLAAEARCLELRAFRDAKPENQADFAP